MPRIEIAKLKTRRGTNNQRKQVVLDQGELVSTVDTKRVYLGTGTLSGGVVVGSKIHSPLVNYYSLSNTVSEVGDIVWVNNKYYQLTATNYSNIDNWIDVNTKIDPVVFNYDSSNVINLNTESISAIYLDPISISNGIKVDSGVLQASLNTKSLEISSLEISIKADGIDEREINSSALSFGLSGGSGEKISLDIDADYFYFNGNTLSLSSVPTTLNDVDGISIVKDGGGIISIDYSPAIGSYELPYINVDAFGRVVEAESAILDVLTGNSNLSSYNSNSSLSALYNGDSLGLSGIEITKFTALSSDGTTIIELSSAGFITFEGGTTTRNNTSVDRFAIPIYRY